MGSSTPKFSSGFTAGGDLSAKQYYIMKAHSTADQVTTCTGAGDVPTGVNYSKPSAAGDGMDLASFSPGTVVKIIVGTAGLTAGWVGTDASGKAVTKTANNDIVFGRVDATYAAADIAEVNCTGISYLGA